MNFISFRPPALFSLSFPAFPPPPLLSVLIAMLRRQTDCRNLWFINSWRHLIITVGHRRISWYSKLNMCSNSMIKVSIYFVIFCRSAVLSQQIKQTLMHGTAISSNSYSPIEQKEGFVIFPADNAENFSIGDLEEILRSVKL